MGSGTTAWIAVLVYLCTLTGTLLIPTARPFFAAFHPGEDAALHAFFSVNMLGAAIGAPLCARLADRTGRRRRIVLLAGVIDGILLLGCALPLPVLALLALRTVQGAANVGALSILMGAAASGARSERSLGLAGGGIVLAIATGAPLGTAALRLGPAAPLFIAAALAVLVGIGGLFPLVDGAGEARMERRALLRARPALWTPILWVTVERFSVGCFVVTFSLWAHHRLGLSDARVGMMFSAFLAPFAVATVLLPRIGGFSRLSPTTSFAWGSVGFAAAFAMLVLSDGALVVPAMLLGGFSSAALYVPALTSVGSLAPPWGRATAMALPNAGGTLGMLAGTACAGIVSAVFARVGAPRELAWTTMFVIAGLAPGCFLLATALAGHRRAEVATVGAVR